MIVRAIGGAPRAGSAVLEVSPADAKVQVDGKVIAGSGSPYTVSELAAGDHEVAVTKSGYSEYHATFAVRGGASTTVPVIELAPNVRDVGFSVRSVPDGAAVWIDSAPTAKVTPARVTGIQPGVHRLQLKHEGFEDYELQMFVPENTVLQLPAAELVAHASPEPQEPAPRSRRGRARSASRDDVANSDEPALSARAARRARRSSASDDSANDTSSARSSARSRRSAASERADRPVRTERQVVAAAEPAKASASGSGKTGTLRLNTRPWSQVVVDGRPIGNTPQPSLELSAGRHKLLLSNPSLGISKNITVTIKAGETNTQVINLAE
jgi:hypothetical protein